MSAPEDSTARLLGCIVRQYAWRRLLASSIGDNLCTHYLLAVELPSGRKFWRLLIEQARTPDDVMLAWAESPARFFEQFRNEENLFPWGGF